MATSSERLFLAAALAALAFAPIAAGQAVQGEALPEGGGVLVPAVTIPPSKAPAPRFSDVRAIPLVGEPVNGFPNWQERVIHEWINRARVDPQADLAGCGANCPENTGGCYTPQPPLIWDANAGRSARYHSAEMGLQSFFDHPSNCTLVSNLSSTYPGSCDGHASCACVGGMSMCKSRLHLMERSNRALRGQRLRRDHRRRLFRREQRVLRLAVGGRQLHVVLLLRGPEPALRHERPPLADSQVEQRGGHGVPERQRQPVHALLHR